MTSRLRTSSHLRCAMSSGTWSPVELNAIALFPFSPNGKFQIALTPGDEIKVQEQAEGWYKGIILSSNKKGIFPQKYVSIREAFCHHPADPSLTEIHGTLREWLTLLKTYYKERKINEYKAMRERLVVMVALVQQFQGADAKVRAHLRTKIADKLEEGKRVMGLDLIIRKHEGTVCTERNTGIIDLYKMHQHAVSPKQVAIISKDGKISAPPARVNSLSPRLAAKAISKKYIETREKHIFLDMKAFMCSIGEPSELFFSIWNKTTNRVLTEEFQVRLTSQGMSYDMDKVGSIKGVFHDIPANYFTEELHLICRVIRKGRIVLDKENPKKGGIDFRRPFAGAVHKLAGVGNVEQEFTLKIYSPTSENNFSNLYEHILKDNGVQEVDKAKGIVISLAIRDGDLEQLLAETPGYAKAPQIPLITFPEVIIPGDIRNDFYLNLDSLEVTQDRTNPTARNVEVVVKVRLDSGPFLSDCISIGTGEKPMSEYRSLVMYHNNNPKIGETFRINIDPENFRVCHVYFELRPCSKKSVDKEKPAFAFAWMKLTKPDNTVVSDGVHPLPTFKPNKENDTWYMKGQLIQDPKVARKGESIKVIASLVSTKLTQNSSMYSLLKWRQSNQTIPDILNRFTFVDSFEITKFFQETFDAMFAILDSQDGVAMLVYDAITHVVSMLVDDKGTNFRPVLDICVDIERHFNGTMAHKHLMASLKAYFTQDTNIQKPVMQSLKALEYVFKFIIASRLLYNKRSASNQMDHSFKADMLDFFQAFNNLMTKNNPNLIGAQTLALKNFSSWFNDLGQIFDKKELAQIACKFVDSVHGFGEKRIKNLSI